MKRQSRPAVAPVVVTVVVGLLLATSAAALPLSFDGPMGFGVSATAADAARATGVVGLEAEQIQQPVDFGFAIPDPLVLDASLVDFPSRSNPIRARSRWSVTNGPEALSESWLVFLHPTNYDPLLAAIDVPPSWGIVHIADESSGERIDFFYPAVPLGDVSPDSTVEFLMRHVVFTELIREGDELILPRYGVGLVLSPATISEPSAALVVSAALCALGVVSRVARR